MTGALGNRSGRQARPGEASSPINPRRPLLRELAWRYILSVRGTSPIKRILCPSSSANFASPFTTPTPTDASKTSIRYEHFHPGISLGSDAQWVLMLAHSISSRLVSQLTIPLVIMDPNKPLTATQKCQQQRGCRDEFVSLLLSPSSDITRPNTPKAKTARSVSRKLDSAASESSTGSSTKNPLLAS